MAELADAADSKSAGTWYLGGSTPPPGTTLKTAPYEGLDDLGKLKTDLQIRSENSL